MQVHLLHDEHGRKGLKAYRSPLALLPMEALASPIAGTITMLQHCLPSVMQLLYSTLVLRDLQPRKNKFMEYIHDSTA